MDSITHIVLGHAMGALATGSSPTVQTAAYWGAFVGNSLPDIDVPVGYLVGRGWAFHRKFTHTIPGMLLLTAAASGTITLAVPGSSFWWTCLWTLAGVVVHVFLDCLNLFGTRPFWPFSDQILGVGVLFILDPIIWAGMGMGSLAHLRGWAGAEAMRLLYVLFWGYVAARWIMLARLRRTLRTPDTRRLVVAPFLAGWRFFRERGGRIEFGSVGILTGREHLLEAVQPASGPAVDASRTVPAVAAFLRRAKFPVAQVEQRDDRYQVVWQDLFMRTRGRPARPIAVLLDAQLQPVD